MAIKIIKQITKGTRNMQAPLNISSIGTSGAIPLVTYTFIPTGGVMPPIIVVNVIIMPNHIGS